MAISASKRVSESRHWSVAPWLQFTVVAVIAIGIAGLSFKYFGDAQSPRRRHRAKAAVPAATPQGA